MFLLSFCPSVLLSFYPSILLSFYPSILLSFYPSVLLSFYPSIFLSLAAFPEAAAFGIGAAEVTRCNVPKQGDYQCNSAMGVFGRLKVLYDSIKVTVVVTGVVTVVVTVVVTGVVTGVE